MASGFVNEFNPPRYPDPKRKIPVALLDFEKNRARTKSRARGTEISENIENFAQFESVMARKEVSGTYDGRINKPVDVLIITEDGNFVLNTENDMDLIKDQI